jgi:hypothetical protein
LIFLEAISSCPLQALGKTTFFQGLKRASVGRFLSPEKNVVLLFVAFHFHLG